ncbi:LOW QUALITY PROTEIN: ionotropic receptor 21a [Panulirus ornatus]|uniref:LOW QUALITY PROTEIN: ionotropic receptor 21a n=1 Tax=Panulirus ornatus TaxID=150431 RepID=UPI003A869BA6
MLTGMSEAVRLVHDASSLPHCSLILLTDGNTSHHTLYQDLGALEMTGVGVLEAQPAAPVANLTLQQRLSKVVSQARRLRQLAWCVTVVVVSDDPAYLSAFAEASDVGRLLKWTNRLLVVTKLLLPDLQHLLRHHWAFSMMNTMFLSMEEATGVLRGNVYTHLPYSPRGARTARVATWSEARGLTLLSHVSLYPEKFANFYGASLNMSVWPFSPYWMEVEETAPNGTKVSKLTGRAYIILETIAQNLNFSINVLPPNNLPDVMLKIEKRVAFMMPMKLAIFPHLLEKYDYTFIIEEATLGFAMAKPKLKPRWQSLYYPMTDEVWASLLTLLLLMPAALLMIMSGEEHHGASVRRAGPVMVVQEIFKTLLGQNLSGRLPRGTSIRLIMGTWLVFAFIMGAAYRGNLTAFLTVPKYPTRPEDLHQLLVTRARVTMPPDLRVNFYEGFKKSNSSAMQTLVKLVSFVPSHDVGLKQAIIMNEAYIYESLFLKLVIAKNFTERDGSTPLYVAREPVVPGYSAWIIPRDAPYKHGLDRCILALHEAGLIRRWSQVVLDEARQRDLSQQGRVKVEEADQTLREEKLGGKIQALTIVHLQGPLFLFLMGLMVSVLSFLLELFLRQHSQ